MFFTLVSIRADSWLVFYFTVSVVFIPRIV